MRRPKETDIKIGYTEGDFPEGDLFQLSDDLFGITQKNWICGTEFCDHIQLVAMFEILDYRDFAEDEDVDENYPIVVQSALVTHPKYFSQEYLGCIDGGTIEDNNYDVYSALWDAYLYGGGVPVNCESVKSGHICKVESKIIEDENFGTYRAFRTFDDAKKYIEDVYAPNMSCITGLIGFVLDRSVNGIGTTGWDFIYNMTEGRDSFKPAWDRMKDARLKMVINNAICYC